MVHAPNRNARVRGRFLVPSNCARLTSVDWSKRTVAVEPTDDKGKSRWLGTSRWLGFEVCQAMRRVLMQEGDAELGLSKRGNCQLEEVRELIAAPERQGSLLIERLGSGRLRWWTFAGGAVNSSVTLRLEDARGIRVDDLWIETDLSTSITQIHLRPVHPAAMQGFVLNLVESSDLKFSACLTQELLVEVVVSRSLDEENLKRLG